MLYLGIVLVLLGTYIGVFVPRVVSDSGERFNTKARWLFRIIGMVLLVIGYTLIIE
tara:strand:+ start:88 stop:255 length:168 start_codon:yes stop_codon:yes gene_type:complete